MTRTIVVSDLHGEPVVLERALDHSRFRQGTDRLIVAGDLIEIGSDPAGVLRRIAELEADVLVGNHELALVVGEPIEEGDPIAPPVAERVADGVLSGEWALALAADGVLVSHAGVSSALQGDFDSHCGRDVAVLAAWLNNAWLADLEQTIERGSIGLGDMTGLSGPLWFRPTGPESLLEGVTQVVGHTPPEIFRDQRAVAALGAAGMHIVDPYVRGWVRDGRPDPAPLRYAVIQGGSVRVHWEPGGGR